MNGTLESATQPESESVAAVAVTGLEVEREAFGRPVAETRDASLSFFPLRPVFEFRSPNLAGRRSC